jgi:Uma2 family endonuclease
MGVTRALPYSRPLTYDDLLALDDDDGHRYELVDGALIVTPSPRQLHQRAVVELLVLLHAAAPDTLQVLVAPFSVVLSQHTVLQPDLLVARRTDFGERDLRVPPLLAIEVLSPSTRHIDAGTKRLAFEAAGVPSYWLVDPDAPSLVVLELTDGTYSEVAHVAGDEAWTATLPFPVTVSPAALVR